MADLDFRTIEKKWQERWAKEKIFEVSEDNKKKKFYLLEMFPYPSASGLHMGHVWNYTIGDVFARFKLMQGFNVLHPMGYDALGLPAENAAIQVGEHPKDYTDKSVKNYIKQQKQLGISYDWNRVLSSANPDYYKWDQWIFLKMLEKGLAYQKESSVNWCPKCNTVLANEQVENGYCWRHEETKVEIKHLKQWFLKITDYADELYEKIDELDWPEKTKVMQKNWIGKSYGTEIDFEINGKKWPIFTTRPDTIFGVTFMVVSAQHERLFELVTKSEKKKVEEFLKKIKTVSQKSMKDVDELNKEGIFTGSYAINPATGEKVPVYAGNFVVADYGSGMIMAVPAHDMRDFEFAKKYGIEIKQVVVPVFKSEDKNKPRNDKKTVYRDSVMLVVKHPSEEKYLYLKWNKFSWQCLVQGGIKEGEDFFDAARRELIEETGYFDIKKIERLPLDMDNVYFAAHKDENRYTHVIPFYIELASEKKQKIDEEELEQFATCWAKTKDLEKVFGEAFKHHFWLVGQVTGKTMIYASDGVLINSGNFNGIESKDAKEKISKWLEEKNEARKVVNFRLRDWLISRQRYWGTPIPVVYCDRCGVVPIPENELPIELPHEVKFGKGNPLETNGKWINTKCPKCNGLAKRETDTMDTFVNSSWYFLRYCDPENNKNIFDKNKVDYWCPIDLYIGGAEHACMHLIYFRFYTKFLRDLGLLNFDEPAIRLFHQGMLHGEDGQKMSKSKGNGVLPEVVSNIYGIDTARFFLCGLASPDKNIDWSEKGILGSMRFINKLFNFYNSIEIDNQNLTFNSKFNRLIKDCTNYLNDLEYRKVIIELRGFFNEISEVSKLPKKILEDYLKLLNPFCPHLTEELWEKLGNKKFISNSDWPKFNIEELNKNKKIDLNEKVFNNIFRIISKLKESQKISCVYLYVLPSEVEKLNIEYFKEKLGFDVKIYSVKDVDKYDPKNMAKKAKPMMPGLYIE